MGRRHSTRDRIVGSDFTLPLVALVTLLCWLLPSPGSWRLWAGAGAALLSAFALTELNSRFSLLRVRSRLVSASYLVLALVAPALHTFVPAVAVPALCLAACYTLLFPAYQLSRAEGYAFHAFLFIGVGSMAFPPLLLVVPPLLFSMQVRLRCLSWRCLFAVLLGLLLPYWLYAAYAVWHNSLDTAFRYLAAWVEPGVPDFSALTLPQLATAGVVLVYAVTAAAHFYSTAYNDKIRTRMFFHLFAAVELFLVAGMLLLPRSYDSWLALLQFNSAPLIAHYFTLGRGRGFGVWFAVSAALFAALAVFNYLVQYGPLSALGTVTPLAGVTLW